MPGGDENGLAPSLAWSGVSDKASYYRLFSAYVMALIATGVATVALAIFAFDLAGEQSATVLGTALSIKMLAYVVAAPVAAALTRAVPRRVLLVTLDLMRAASLLLLPFMTGVGQVYALVFAFALASATFTLVYMTVVPYLLGSAEDYSLSLARSRIASEVDNSVSPLLAAGLLLAVSSAGVFVLATAVFVVSAFLVQTVRIPAMRAAPDGGIWRQVLRGPRLFLAVPEFRSVIALDVAVALATAMVMVNTVVLVQGGFDLDRRASAIAFAAFGLGSIAGALLMPRVLRRVADRSVMLAGAALLTLGLICSAWVDAYSMLLAVWPLIGMGVALALTPVTYLIRRLAPPEDLQTLFAAQFSIANGCLLVAYSAAGWAGAALGMPAAFLVIGLAAGLAALLAAGLWPRARAASDV